MKVVIFAGGFGTRLMEETEGRPKPILWHIMKIFEKYGYSDFVLCLGYKADYIFILNRSDCSIHMVKAKVQVH